MKRARFLILVLVLLALASVPSAAAPQAGPCAPGMAYDPACDVNQDGQITITDIQLTAGHWNQSGTWVSDNQHNHLGQTWTEGGPLRITGYFPGLGVAAMYITNTASTSYNYGLIAESPCCTGVIGAGGDVGVFGVGGNWGVNAHSTNYDTHAYLAGYNGLRLYYAPNDGLVVGDVGDDGIQIGDDTGYPSYGLYVPTPGTPENALWPNTSDPAGEWALYTVDNIEAANVFLSAQTLVAVVGDDQPLSPGDVVTAMGLADPIPGALNRLALMTLATTERANVVGVVSSRMALQPAPGKEGEQVMHSTDGPAQPGDYVAITVLGAAQVKVAPGEAIQPGQRLTVAATPGQARALQSKLIEGMMVTEGASVIGVALEAPKDGLAWVLVNPQ